MEESRRNYVNPRAARGRGIRYLTPPPHRVYRAIRYMIQKLQHMFYKNVIFGMSRTHFQLKYSLFSEKSRNYGKKKNIKSSLSRKNKTICHTLHDAFLYIKAYKKLSGCNIRIFTQFFCSKTINICIVKNKLQKVYRALYTWSIKRHTLKSAILQGNL